MIPHESTLPLTDPEVATFRARLLLSAEARAVPNVIDDALARIRAGTYGTCVDCGLFLGRPLLNERPWADRCRGCGELLLRAGPPLRAHHPHHG